MAASTTKTERFWAKVARGEGCWEWTGRLNAAGYGCFDFGKGHTVLAHRLAYEFSIGNVPIGRELDHLCRNPKCVRPDHLDPVTHKVNMERGRFGAATHCVAGHAFNSENTYVTSAGKRQCRACKSRRMREFYEKHPLYWREGLSA